MYPFERRDEIIYFPSSNRVVDCAAASRQVTAADNLGGAGDGLAARLRSRQESNGSKPSPGRVPRLGRTLVESSPRGQNAAALDPSCPMAGGWRHELSVTMERMTTGDHR